MTITTVQELAERAATDGLAAINKAIDHTTRYHKAGRFHTYGVPTRVEYDSLLRWRMLPRHVVYYLDANRQLVAWRAYDMLAYKHKGLSGINIVAYWNVAEPEPSFGVAIDRSDNAVFQSVLTRMSIKHIYIMEYDERLQTYALQA